MVFVALIAALHVLKPEIDPSWRFLSEYALGRHGWLMAVAFAALAVSHVGLFLAVRHEAMAWQGRAGLALLLIGATGLLLAAAFTTDPITMPPGAATLSGRLHSLGGALGIAMPFAALLLSWGLACHPAWRSARCSLLAAAGIAFAGFVVSFSWLATLMARSEGRFGPDVAVGLPNRVELATYCLWLMATARARITIGTASKSGTC